MQNSQENTCVGFYFLNEVAGCTRLFMVKDSLMVSENNIDESVVSEDFKIHGLSPPWRINLNTKEGRILLHVFHESTVLMCN